MVDQLCKRLCESDFKINIKKCVFNADKIEYFGFVVDKNGIHQTMDKTKAIVEAPQPQNSKQLQSFLGVVTYYDKFIKNRATILQLLYNLLKKGDMAMDARVHTSIRKYQERTSITKSLDTL